MERKKWRLVNVTECERFYERVDFKTCWRHKGSISPQPREVKASFTGVMLKQNIQGRDATLKLAKGRWASRAERTKWCRVGKQLFRELMAIWPQEVRRGGGEESKEKGKGLDLGGTVGVMHGGLGFILGGMIPLKGFPAEKGDINVIIITAFSVIGLECILCLGLRTVPPSSHHNPGER